MKFWHTLLLHLMSVVCLLLTASAPCTLYVEYRRWALIVVDRRNRGVNGNLMEVGSTQSRQLGIDVGVNPSMQQGIVAEIDARNDMRGTKRDLFRFCKERIGVAIERHLADPLYRNEFFGNELRRVEDVEGKRIGLRVVEKLHA